LLTQNLVDMRRRNGRKPSTIASNNYPFAIRPRHHHFRGII
jgi:hypothetical protein